MANINFIYFTIEHWSSILVWSICYMLVLYILFSKVANANKYDPIHFFISFNYGSGYGVLTSLYQFGYITNRLFFIVIGYGLLLFLSLYFFLNTPLHFKDKFYRKLFKVKTNGKIEFKLIFIIYLGLALYLLINSNFGALAETNRFEQARGFGVIVRILDLLRLFIIAYISIAIFNNYSQHEKKFPLKIKLIGLIFFLIFSSLLNGAKYAMLEGLYVSFVALYAIGYHFKLNIFTTISIFLFALFFAILILNLNNRNESNSNGLYSQDGNPLIEKFIARILANGDAYYGSLPNEVIDHIQRDNVIVRFASPIVGVSRLSKLLGYPVEDYSVGRAILLYHDPKNIISGGPVSKVELFAYVYLGNLGFIFIILVSFLLSTIHKEIKKTSQNIYYISILSTLWVRALQILIEPPVGFAYIIDTIIIFLAIKILSQILVTISKINYK